ncbi:MAG: hypothetical protein JW716_00535 [Candidatus Aenigmarchaeota archaeon]|nr:hypothetical protein [Candidatus Aenigmarchaeota archaeon]
MYSAEDMEKMEEMKKLEKLKKQLLMKALTKEAYERLARVRSVNPAIANQAELYIIQIQQGGKLLRPVTDEKLKEVLSLLSGEKQNFRIKRK